MQQEVFKENIIMSLILALVLTVVGIIGVFQAFFPWWVAIIFILVACFILLLHVKAKVVVDKGEISYQTLGNRESVSLDRVYEIATREVETIVDHSRDRDKGGSNSVTIGNITLGDGKAKDQRREVKRYIYLLDQDGRTLFSFPAKMVNFMHRDRFKEAIHRHNPNIDIY